MHFVNGYPSSRCGIVDFAKAVLNSSLTTELEKHLGKARLQSWSQKQNLIHKDSIDTFRQELKLVAHYDHLVGSAEEIQRGASHSKAFKPTSKAPFGAREAICDAYLLGLV